MLRKPMSVPIIGMTRIQIVSGFESYMSVARVIENKCPEAVHTLHTTPYN
jgi:hypothetical protein